MEVIVYAHVENPQKEMLVSQVFQSIHPGPVVVSCLDGVFKLLRSKISGRVIVVFMISSEKELDTLFKSRARLFNTRYIIVLPEYDDPMASKALRLRPRYLGYPTHGYADIGTVLEKMIQKYKSL